MQTRVFHQRFRTGLFYIKSLQLTAYGLWLLFALGISLPSVRASSVFIQPIHEGPKTPDGNPQTYLKITINGDLYCCALLDDWKIFENFGGMDFIAAPPGGQSGSIGVKIEPCLDPDGKPYPFFTQKLLDAQIKRLQPEGPVYKGDAPTLSGDVTTVELDHLRIEERRAWKCHYVLRLVGDRLWTFACEAPPDHYDMVFQKLALLTGTFVSTPKER